MRALNIMAERYHVSNHYENFTFRSRVSSFDIRDGTRPIADDRPVLWIVIVQLLRKGHDDLKSLEVLVKKEGHARNWEW